MTDGGRVEADTDPLATLRGYLALERDVLVLSAAMFAFSLGYQGTNQYMAEYLYALGAGPLVVGLFGSFGNLVSAVYPYPGGRVSDRIGSRRALTLFGLLSAVGFAVWAVAGLVPSVVVPAFAVGPVAVPELVLPVAVFLGLPLVQCWKSFGLGATFAVVKQSVEPSRLATAFAATETVRRLAFLLGPLLVAAALSVYAFEVGFRVVLAGAAAVALVGTLAQHYLYDASNDSLGKSFAGVESVLADLGALPDELPPLLAADTLVRFANGMVYVFFVVFVVEYLGGPVALPVVGALSPQAFFGVLLAVEMAVALASMLPVSRMADRVGLKPVVGLGFLVYAVFPALLVLAPGETVAVGPLSVPPAAVLVGLFALSGLRFAGLPAHKALIVGPAERDAGGRVTGSYYLVRNAVTVPSAAVGGALYAVSPAVAFGVATAIGLAGVAVFAVAGRGFDAAE
ncbi:MFS transporter [Halosegnis marinus]|uniref:MFS transporter n=1 Tax=Halosegnis marinus TaxID=3034023 RepID=A0ABD5ZP19_9EURY|nr:MFS transporter [Halosegnis sp. DT85]